MNTFEERRLESERQAYLEEAKKDPEGHKWVPGYIYPSGEGKEPSLAGFIRHQIRNEAVANNSLHEQRQKDISQGVDVD